MRNQASASIDRLKCRAFVEAYSLAEEDPNEFRAFCEQVFLEHRPCGASEEACVLSIAKLLWRKDRPGSIRSMDDRPLTLDEVAAEFGGIEYLALSEADRDEFNGREQLDVNADDAEFSSELDAQVSEEENHLAELKRVKILAGLARRPLR